MSAKESQTEQSRDEENIKHEERRQQFIADLTEKCSCETDAYIRDDGLTVPCGCCRVRHFVENADKEIEEQNRNRCTLKEPLESVDNQITINRAKLDKIRRSEEQYAQAQARSRDRDSNRSK